MNCSRYLIIHRDHAFDPEGINSGAEMATLFLCRYLVKAGMQVTLAGQFTRAPQTVSGFECWNLGADFSVKAAIDHVSAQGAYHLISAGRALPLMIAEKDSNCRSRSIITHDRASNDTGLSAKVLSCIADNIFCVSNAQREFFLKDGVDPKKLKVIHNGVDLDLFPASEFAKRDPNKLIFVGATVVDKGLHILLESFAKLKSKHPKLSLDIYGSAELWGRDNYIDPRQIEAQLPDVKFHGKVPQQTVSQAMQKAGLCVVPSIWFDPFPLVSIDAQATGCPVVAFDVGGLKEGIQDESTGKVVKEVSEAALSNALDQILSNRAVHKVYSDNAIKLSRPRFTWPRLVERVIAECEAAGDKNVSKETTISSPRIALFSTWNQRCGLATYAGYLFSQFPKNDFIVLAEKTEQPLTKDSENVYRCWRKESTDFMAIIEILKAERIEILFFNFHTHFRLFPQVELINFMLAAKAFGIKIVAHVHNTYSIEPRLSSFLKHADCVLVLGPENRLEAIANGAAAEKTVWIPHGVHMPVGQKSREAIRSKLGIAENTKVVCSFGFVQAHKGIEGMIEAVAHLNAKGLDVTGYVLGGANISDSSSQEYLNQLKQLSQRLGLQKNIIFKEGFIPDAEIEDYLIASDLVLMNYRTQHFEASGACSIALGAGALVATSIAPPFFPFKDAVWHITSGYNIVTSSELLLTNQALASEIREKARTYCRENSWPAVAQKVNLIFNQLLKTTKAKRETKVRDSDSGMRQIGKGMKVLMQNRNNTMTQRGGDTFLIEKTIEGLKRKGVSVTLDLEGKENPANYDLVHLFNFVLADMVKFYAERATQAKVPYVVTTLYEDISRFHNPSVLQAKVLNDYVKGGQNRAWFEANRINPSQIEACANFNNTWAAEHAAALIANGDEEAATLKKDYPSANVEIVPVGYDIGVEGDAETFFREYGVKDFVLCVGRLESRKNQLMLLKALEDSELTVVLAAGGFSYQPEYEASVRNFKRKGKTLVLDKLSNQMLANAYCAAKVHVLPSWYELPGLVSLEAAYYGCNVVVTDYGTARSYFGDLARYCNPASEASILEAVLAAYYSPLTAGLKELSMKYTWDNAADKTLQVYGKVLAESEATQTASASTQVFDLDSQVTHFQDVLERGEMAAKEKDLPAAEKHLDEAERLDPNSVRMIRARGAVALAKGDIVRARAYFERGLRLDSANARLYSGLGMCEMQSGEPAKAHALFVKALEIAPHELVAILQLLECSYTLNEYGDLERVLRRYLKDHAQDMQMQYCLAGCLFKQNKLAESERLTDAILKADASNLGAKQLKAAIEEAHAAANLNATPVVELKAENVAFNMPKINIKLPDMPAASAPAEQSADKREAQVIKPAFDATDREITEFEELKRAKKYDEVVKLATEKLNSPLLNPAQKERLTLLLAECEVLTGEIVKADARFNEILEGNSQSARAMCGKGAIAASRGQWDVANDFFTKANSIDVNYDVAWAGLGLYSYSKEDYEAAWSRFMRAIELNAENVRALLGIIELGYSLGRLSEVEHVLKLYLDMHPLDLNFLYSLAGCYFAQDKLSEAVAELDKIRMFEPENKNAQELREMIEQKLSAGSIGVNA